MKKAFVFLAALVMLCLPVMASGGGHAAAIESIPLWLCIPFAGILLSIAVFPLVRAEWWEEHQPIVVALWSLLFLVPFAAMYGSAAAAETVLECIVNDYLRISAALQ